MEIDLGGTADVADQRRQPRHHVETDRRAADAEVDRTRLLPRRRVTREERERNGALGRQRRSRLLVELQVHGHAALSVAQSAGQAFEGQLSIGPALHGEFRRHPGLRPRAAHIGDASHDAAHTQIGAAVQRLQIGQLHLVHGHVERRGRGRVHTDRAGNVNPLRAVAERQALHFDGLTIVCHRRGCAARERPRVAARDEREPRHLRRVMSFAEHHSCLRLELARAARGIEVDLEPAAFVRHLSVEEVHRLPRHLQLRGPKGGLDARAGGRQVGKAHAVGRVHRGRGDAADGREGVDVRLAFRGECPGVPAEGAGCRDRPAERLAERRADACQRSLFDLVAEIGAACLTERDGTRRFHVPVGTRDGRSVERQHTAAECAREGGGRNRDLPELRVAQRDDSLESDPLEDQWRRQIGEGHLTLDRAVQLAGQCRAAGHEIELERCEAGIEIDGQRPLSNRRAQRRRSRQLRPEEHRVPQREVGTQAEPIERPSGCVHGKHARQAPREQPVRHGRHLQGASEPHEIESCDRSGGPVAQIPGGPVHVAR